MKRAGLLHSGINRRSLLAGAGAAAGLASLPTRLLAQEPLSVAGIYTVPVEQQWVSRIHIAAEAAAGELQDWLNTFAQIHEDNHIGVGREL